MNFVSFGITILVQFLRSNNKTTTIAILVQAFTFLRALHGERYSEIHSIVMNFPRLARRGKFSLFQHRVTCILVEDNKDVQG